MEVDQIYDKEVRFDEQRGETLLTYRTTNDRTDEAPKRDETLRQTV